MVTPFPPRVVTWSTRDFPEVETTWDRERETEYGPSFFLRHWDSGPNPRVDPEDRTQSRDLCPGGLLPVVKISFIPV